MGAGGDTIARISKRFGVFPSDLCTLNKIPMVSTDMRIAAGTVLRLPSGGAQAKRPLRAPLKAGSIVTVMVRGGDERLAVVVDGGSEGKLVVVKMLDKWDQEEAMQVAPSCLRQVSDAEMKLSVHRWITRMGNWMFRDKNRGPDAVLSSEKLADLEKLLHSLLEHSTAPGARTDAAVYRLSLAKTEPEVDPATLLPEIGEHPADEILRDVAVVVKGLADAQMFAANVEGKKLLEIHEMAKAAVPRSAASVEAIKKASPPRHPHQPASHMLIMMQPSLWLRPLGLWLTRPLLFSPSCPASFCIKIPRHIQQSDLDTYPTMFP